MNDKYRVFPPLAEDEIVEAKTRVLTIDMLERAALACGPPAETMEIQVPWIYLEDARGWRIQDKDGRVLSRGKWPPKEGA